MRNVANLAPPFEEGAGYHGVSAAIEFAVAQLYVETVLVLGHAQCGGVAAALSDRPRDPNSFLDRWIGLLDRAKSRIERLRRRSPFERWSMNPSGSLWKTWPRFHSSSRRLTSAA